ncbi:glycosyltransferase family 2 protein, partial [Enterobacter hormaechei]
VNHHGSAYQQFLKQHRDEPLLNAGLLGGSREDVMEFAHRIIRLYYRIESHRFWKMETAPATLVDMGAFGMAAKSFGDRIVTGPRIHTVFKTDGFGKESAWWKHK